MASDHPSLTAPDGSTVKELIQTRDGAQNQSLAEASVPPNGQTILHRHRQSEEIYLFSAGAGRMLLGNEEMEIAAGDAILIPPGTPHKLINKSDEPLVLLCCCSPPYRDEDTEFLE
jgi:mannose-6-phosphate isomerase-like protein (cupin superfamily)